MKGDSDENPLYDLVGILDDEEAEHVRERVGEFRDSVSEEIDSFRSG